MLLHLKIPTLSGEVTKELFRLSLFLRLCMSLALSQKAQPDDDTLPKYDLHTETKTKGVVDEVTMLPLGTRKDFPELIIKSGEDKVHIYLCPKPFQEDLGVSFSKGDEIAGTGSKVQAGSVGRDPCSGAREGCGHSSVS